MAPLSERISKTRTYFESLPQAHELTLEPETLIRYSDKLQPFFTDDFLSALAERGLESLEMKASQFFLSQALSAPIFSVTNLTVQPGEPGFEVWLIISSYFPLISACMAPISNLISLVSLIEKWGFISETGQSLDEKTISVLNIISFALGICGNASLVLNFSQRLRYMTLQFASISCWLVAGSGLLAAVILTTVKAGHIDGDVFFSEGYYFAIFTVFFYYACASIQSINFLGYSLKKYPPVFNLSLRQRSLMMYILCFAVWEIIGTISFRYLLEDATYGTSLYFCTVSILTIGYGDIIPESTGAKVFDLIFCLVGIILVGLIIAMIRQVVLTSAAPCIFWNRVEIKREKLVKQLGSEHVVLKPKQAFAEMRRIRGEVKLRQANMSFLFTLSFFIIFWLVGALIFAHVESWTYFTGVYFGFITLLTIGYGENHPNVPLARSIFVVWAFFAVPLMTILISNASDSIFEWAERLLKAATCLMHWKSYYGVIKAVHRRWSRKLRVKTPVVHVPQNTTLYRQRSYPRTHCGLIALNLQDEPEENKILSEERLRTLRASVKDEYETVKNILVRIESLKKLLVDSLDEPTKRYTHDEWMEHLGALNLDSVNGEEPEFWISAQSPLRLPIKEPNFLMLKMFVGLEQDVVDLLDLQRRSIETLRKFCFEHGINPEEIDAQGSAESLNLVLGALSLNLEATGLDDDANST